MARDIKIVVVEDDVGALQSLVELLSIDGFIVKGFSSPQKAFSFLKKEEVDVVISDIKMPEMSGMELLEKVKNEFPEIDVILMTAFGDIDNAVNAIKKGASHYLIKPLNYEELIRVLENISEVRRLKNVVSLDSQQDIELVSNSKEMKRVLREVEKVAKTDSTVIVSGETGVGKELVARLIHKRSRRASHAFVPVNCAAIPKDLLEAELFGYEKGSFTGAIKSKKGKFLLANKGSIFLDEVAEMDVNIQAKFLRVLEDGMVEVIGAEHPVKTDVRIIAATNRDLENLVKEGKFREDLFFRLNVFKIEIPPLRERKEDIKPLSEHFLRVYAKKYRKEIDSISEEVIRILESYHFPGNVRELKHIIERAVIIADERVLKKEHIALMGLDKPVKSKDTIQIPYGASLKEAEKIIILETLKRTNFNKRKTAEILGISVRKIELKFKEWGTSLKEIKSSY